MSHRCPKRYLLFLPTKINPLIWYPIFSPKCQYTGHFLHSCRFAWLPTKGMRFCKLQTCFTSIRNEGILSSCWWFICIKGRNSYSLCAKSRFSSRSSYATIVEEDAPWWFFISCDQARGILSNTDSTNVIFKLVCHSSKQGRQSLSYDTAARAFWLWFGIIFSSTAYMSLSSTSIRTMAWYSGKAALASPIELAGALVFHLHRVLLRELSWASHA